MCICSIKPEGSTFQRNKRKLNACEHQTIKAACEKTECITIQNASLEVGRHNLWRVYLRHFWDIFFTGLKSPSWGQFTSDCRLHHRVTPYALYSLNRLLTAVEGLGEGHAVHITYNRQNLRAPFAYCTFMTMEISCRKGSDWQFQGQVRGSSNYHWFSWRSLHDVTGEQSGRLLSILPIISAAANEQEPNYFEYLIYRPFSQMLNLFSLQPQVALQFI